MTSNHTDQTSWTQLTDLAKEAFERQLKLGREYAELARSSLAGEGDRTALGRAYLTAVRRESEHYWREMSTLGVGYAADVAALGIRVGSAVARDMRSAMAGHSRTTGPQGRTAPSGSSAASAAPNGGTSAPSADVALHAPAGQIATATVTVANKHPRARRISLSAGPIHDDAGAELDARVTIVPRQVTVPAGEEEAILLSLAITAEDFALGSAYRCVVEITGGEEATVSVLISRDPA